MRVGSLFSGIGGLDLGLERAGMEVVWQVEVDEWCRGVLAKHWPNVPQYGDIRELVGDEVEAVDLICGGFPCQPASSVGKRRGTADERWLWPEMARLIRVLRPRLVLMENVPGLFHRGFADVLADLAESGYDAEWDCLPAAAFGAPHLRDRIFIIGTQHPRTLADTSGGRRSPDDVQAGRDAAGSSGAALAHATSARRDRGQGEEQFIQRPPSLSPRSSRCSEVAYATGSRPTYSCESEARGQLARWHAPARFGWWDAEPDVGRVAHGVPARVDRLRGLGNAVVPQVAEWIGRQIMTAEAS
jgi:DNA (cytosine-5)-methyltransferase 1